MLIPCGTCSGFSSNNGISCTVCGGDGKVDLTDDAFRQITLGDQIALTGQIWSMLLAEIAAIKAKTDNLPEDITSDLSDILGKCTDIFEKLNE